MSESLITHPFIPATPGQIARVPIISAKRGLVIDTVWDQ